MKLFIAGICGTFMAGIAQLAQACGHEVEGCDSNVYPPMSTLLEQSDIAVMKGYQASHLEKDYDLVIIGNALSRGNPLVEAVLDRGLPYQSGPQWLHDNILQHRKVIAVAGTHGKTTTSAMIVHILTSNGIGPGFLVGGKPGNSDRSAEIGESDWFVIEADEYDTAFFDKRSKFVHYCPKIAVLNNLEFDHADIFANMAQIRTQFHHLVRIVPASGTIIANADDPEIQDVLDMGCWSDTSGVSIENPDNTWFARATVADASRFEVFHNDVLSGQIAWQCLGQHNMYNGLAAVAATHSAGVSVADACRVLADFVAADRRLQLLFQGGENYLYNDFAHHPTAIRLTLQAIRARHPDCDLVAVVEPRSNTMKSGAHGDSLGKSLDQADATFIYSPGDLDWDPASLHTASALKVSETAAGLMDSLKLRIKANSVIICMSNGSFDDIPGMLGEHLHERLVETAS